MATVTACHVEHKASSTNAMEADKKFLGMRLIKDAVAFLAPSFTTCADKRHDFSNTVKGSGRSDLVVSVNGGKFRNCATLWPNTIEHAKLHIFLASDKLVKCQVLTPTCRSNGIFWTLTEGPSFDLHAARGGNCMLLEALHMHEYQRYSPRGKKFADGVGMAYPDAFQTLLMEASSAESEEDVAKHFWPRMRMRVGRNTCNIFAPRSRRVTRVETRQSPTTSVTRHTLGDSVKLLESSVLALRHMLASYKDAQWSTMKLLSVLSLQFIHGKMTLMRTRVAQTTEGYQWEVVELQSAEVRRVWTDIKKSMRIAEIIATVFLTQKEQRTILNQAEGELCGFSGGDAETVREVLEALE
ncbi:hypothetical protein HDU87_002160 [Geranomyces variabilis]|uniref:Uncharacterized protein n=1 Tax=Geranomyces variabilis TaxID=109894 RepID=A0AAD5TLJ6_9FUNG|nr:hypothetical protein HDU87_002160 [Geranomyces variabilis]